LIWSYALSDSHHATGYRERLDAGGNVHRVAGQPLGLDHHLAHVDADAYWNIVPGKLLLDRNPGEHGRERAREHAHAAVPETLDDRPAERFVMVLECAHVPVALGDCQVLVRLHQRRVPDHVGEHHGNEATIEPLTHRASSPR
jgi:hypothetical protein